jgi:thiamine-phosphate pyrophosphorylase
VIARVVAVTPGDHGTGRELVSVAEGLARGGILSIVLREPQLDERAYVTLARKLAPIFPGGVALHAKHPSALELAAVGDWGLHLPYGANLKDARARVRGRLGVSCHSMIEVAAARGAGADYVFVAPVFHPLSKPDDRRRPIGLDELRRVAESAGIPVFAQGGIDASNARACLEAGAAGIAVTGALFSDGAGPEETEALARALTGNRHVLRAARVR